MADDRKNRSANYDQTVPCHICGTMEPLVTAEDHHIQPRAFGGTDAAMNRVWLCASCHTRIHRIQGLLVKGQQSAAYQVCQTIFPTNGKARGELWTLANEAMNTEREAKEAFHSHQTHRKVSLSVEVDVWNVIKAEAKARKMSASKFAAGILKQAVMTRL